jgi:hypothetical protein
VKLLTISLWTPCKLLMNISHCLCKCTKSQKYSCLPSFRFNILQTFYLCKTSCKLLTYQLLVKLSWASFNFIRTCYKVIMNFLWNSKKLLTSFLWTYYKLLMNFFQNYNKILTFYTLLHTLPTSFFQTLFGQRYFITKMFMFTTVSKGIATLRKIVRLS